MYEAQKKYKKALSSHLIFAQKEREIFNEDKVRQISEIKTNYEVEKKDAEARILREKNAELEDTNKKLKEANERIKVLSGMIPICCNCKKIRDDEGFWNQIEVYISKHSEAEFSHGICPDCIDMLYRIYKGR